MLTGATPAAVIARLDRATQYTTPPVFVLEALRLLDPRMRGDDMLPRGVAFTFKPESP
jgi:hypothetical protein